MLLLLHLLPYVLFAGLGMLLLTVLFGDDVAAGKRSHPQRLPRQYYNWKEHRADRD